ncbi:MAG: phospholipid carrier-dependent glycosyltransferase [bacterium]|nr:phospholipid carrier-dependent glycosyltransferase [bacterium]
MKKQHWPVLVLSIGIFLRFYGINWALPHIFHPDETRLLYAINDISWDSWENLNLNPKFFAYGSLPIYLLKAIYDFGQWLSREFRQPLYGNFFFVGRALSAFFGSLTLIIVYLFGSRFFSRRAGLLAAAFLGFTVLHIQLSHFLTVDVMLTFFIVAALYIFGRLAEGAHPVRNYLLAGMVLGLAMATKISALPLYGVFFLAHILALMQRKHTLRGIWRPASAFWGLFIAALLLSVLVFALCSPYAILDFNEFYRQVKEQSDMVRGITQPPYVIQFEGTPKYWYPLQQVISYSMGLPLGLLTLGGTFFLLFTTLSNVIRLCSRRKPYNRQSSVENPKILIFAWLVPVFWTVGGFEVKFLRYMLPLIPFFCLLGAVFVDELLARFPSRKIVVSTLVLCVIGFSAFYSLSYISIYRHEDPRVQASRWIYEHVEPGAGLLTELWEFAPLTHVDGHHPGEYRELQLDLYGPDHDRKIRTIAQQLSESEVIVMATRRLYSSILRVPERYPLTSNYYKLLFDGSLGFQPVEPFTSYPSLVGISFNDDLADESFSVYDHPKTILFWKSEALSADELYSLIMTAPPLDQAAASILLKRLLRFPAHESRYEALSNQPTAPNSASVLISGQWRMILLWLLSVEFLGMLAFPLSSLSFRFLPDKGYAVTKILGLLLPFYLVWLGSNLELFAYSRQNILLVIGLFIMLAATIAWRYRDFLTEILTEHWKIFLVYEALFLAGFAAFILFRAYNPDIFWSESSMDFSFLSVLNRTTMLPPPDPWISGFPLNYYYFGHYLVATLGKVTNILPQISYNLAFALFPALVLLEVFSLLYNLTQRYLAGLLAVCFSSIISNLDGFFLFKDMLAGHEGIYRYFRPAHEVIPYTVHEFPFWTFIFVDLHAHLLNMPFLIAVFLIGLNLLFKERRGYRQEPVLKGFRTGERVIEAILYLLIVGTLGAISSWDYPSGVIFLILMGLLISCRNRSKLGQQWKIALRPLVYVIAVIIPGSLLAFIPFYTGFSRSGMGLGLVGNATTLLSDYLTIFGFFFFAILSYLIFRAGRLRFTAHPWRVFLILLLAAGFIYAGALQFFLLNYATLLFLLGTISFGSYVMLAQTDMNSDLSPLYVWLCLIYACLIAAGCEIVFVRDFLQGGEYKRMNTIFKFYIPAWFLFAFAASYSLLQIQALFQSRRGRIKRYLVIGQKFWYFCFALFLAASLIFPVMAVRARRNQQDVYGRSYMPLTLDGLAYIHSLNPGEYQAMAWLNEHIAGTPVILEACGSDYRYEYARVSANTGLPTVLGWQSHAEQREHWGQAQQRVQDIKTIYSSPDMTRVLQLLRSYQVEYIYIGETEGRDFTQKQLQKFGQQPEYFQKVFESGETVIYQVL